jgi:hypothetical protein
MKTRDRSRTKQSESAPVTSRSVSAALSALMKSDPTSFAWLIIDGFDKLATLDPQGFNGLVSAITTRKERFEVVIETTMSRISFGKYPTREARSLAAAIKASPRVILNVELWFALLGTSELHLSRTSNG